MKITTIHKKIPSLNDSEENFRKIAKFIKNLDDGIPWHVIRFHPAYKLIDLPPTPVSILDKVYPYVLALNESLTKADKGAAFTSGEYLYNQGANRFVVDEHMLIMVGENASALFNLIRSYVGNFPA